MFGFLKKKNPALEQEVQEQGPTKSKSPGRMDPHSCREVFKDNLSGRTDPVPF